MKPLTVSTNRMTLLEDGKPFVWRGTLDWPLYGRFLNEGVDVTRGVMADRRSVGANTICCAGMLGWWPGLNPSNPQYWDSLRPFVELAEQQDMRICFVVFCDTATLMPDRASMEAHYERFLVTLGDKTNVTFVGVNQPGHHTQSRDCNPLRFSKPPSFPSLLCARDNPLEQGNPTLPAQDFSCYCSRRDYPKGYIEVGSSMFYVVEGWADAGIVWQGSHQASVLFEPLHCRPHDWTGSPGVWRQLARSLAFAGTAGGNFYSDQCSQAALLTDVERMCAVEFCGNLPTP